MFGFYLEGSKESLKEFTWENNSQICTLERSLKRMHWSILKLEALEIMRKMSSWAKVAGRLEESIV